MSASDRRRLRISCAGAIAAAALVVGLVQGLAPGRTGARIVTWYGPDGQVIERRPEGALYPFNGCTGDIGLTGLVHDGGSAA